MKLRLIDAHSLVYRSYHALPHDRGGGLRNPAGDPVGAVYGVTRMLMNFAKRIEEGDCVAAVFDAHRRGQCWRSKIDPQYKAHRGPSNPDLVKQIPMCREVAALLGFNPVSVDGYEADDVIATYATAWMDIEICSPDKDLLCLMSLSVEIFDPLKDRIVTIDHVREKFGVYPWDMPGLLALAGDSADNIEGVPGIGPKTAAGLLNSFDTLDGVFRNLALVKPPRIQSLLRAYEAQARAAHALVTLKTDVPLPVPIDALRYTGPDHEGLRTFLEKNAFASLLAEAA